MKNTPIGCRVLLAGWILNAVATSSLWAQQAGDWDSMRDIRPRAYACVLANQPIVVDGELADPAWESAAWTDDFVDIEGERRPTPRLRTRAKLLWDRSYLYIAAELVEPHVWGTLTQHDSVIFHDNDFEVFIDPDGDHHEYYELELNALNTTWDLFLPRPYKDGGQADNGWEIPGLKSAVRVDGTINNPSDEDRGWTVELAIPWEALGQHARRSTPPSPGDRWRLNFSRVEWQHMVTDGKYEKVANTREDNWVWSPQGIIDMHRPERWGVVQFIDPALVATATLPPEWTIRETLMEVYHRQRVYHQRQGRWASSLTDLGYPIPDANLSPRFRMTAASDGFEASITTEHPHQGQWRVRQDSRLWFVDTPDRITAALAQAGDNRGQLELALRDVPPAEREGMEFLIANMPDRDLRELSAEYLLENVRLAYQAWRESPWREQIPREIFLNHILPYANINESRDRWRRELREKFQPLIAGAKSPGQAAAWLNQRVFPLVKVRYSTQRAKADQSPLESMNSGLASCTGLSVLLIDACRAVGVPARFVGTPLWSDNSGNHSWVEIWDQGWHFTGAAEPNGDELDKAWFIDRAANCREDDPRHAIYAVSFQRAPLKFPLVWDRSIDYVSAVNVTSRYVGKSSPPAAGMVRLMLRVRDNADGRRVAAPIRIAAADGAVLFTGTSKDERFDTNDHLTVDLPAEREVQVEIGSGAQIVRERLRVQPRTEPVTWYLPTTIPGATDAVPAVSPDSATLQALKQYLAQPAEERPAIDQQPFATVALTKTEAAAAADLLWQDHLQTMRRTRAKEMEAKELILGDLKMPFFYHVYGDKPPGGRSLYLSLHGGGGAPPAVNDQQWQNQKRLYQPAEGVYVAPRAPTNTWDLWHQSHIDSFFDRLIENLIVFEDVNPNRVYLLGYSAGGDGVYQLAPRLADRWAAAAMMAGHPNETSPLGLRNVPFALQVGARDAAYRRNEEAASWEKKLAELRQADPTGYVHWVKIHEGKGHWMDREDAVALPWMAKHTREPWPTRIVWKQDDVVRNRFYWLAVNRKEIRDRAEVRATRAGQVVSVETTDADRITIRFSDAAQDLDQPVIVRAGDRELFQGRVPRTVLVLAHTLAERGDRSAMASAETVVDLPGK